MKRFKRIYALFQPVLILMSLLILMSIYSGTAGAALLDFGPIVPEVVGSTPPTLQTGFPAWFRDSNRVPLQLCLEEVPGCLFAAVDRPDLTQPLAFPNIPDELFYYSATATIGQQLLFAGVEMNFFDNGDGTYEQVGFSRVRIRIDSTVAGKYTITTPWKQYFFNVDQATIDANAGRRVINATEDIGLGPDGVFTGVLGGSIGPYVFSQGAPFVTAAGSFIGTGAALPVQGSTFTDPVTGQPANIFRVEGPPGFATVSTNQFAITGKLYLDPIPTPLTVDKATYSRNALATEKQVNVFATTQALSNQVNSAALPFPARFALTGVDSALQLAGTDIPTQSLTTNSPADGRFFAASGILPDTGNLPATITVTNVNDTPPTVATVPLVDEVIIEKAAYAPQTSTLTVQASSSDRVALPALQVFFPGTTAPLGTLAANGQLDITFPVTVGQGQGAITYNIPPQDVTVVSAKGGTLTVPVTTFQENIYIITAVAAPNGTISPAGATVVAANGSQTYTITPNTGFTVANLVVDGTVLPGATSYTFTNVTASHYINAYFTEQTFTVTASAGANGTITPSGPATVLYGTSSNFTITPDAGFQIETLVVDGVTLPVASSYTFTNITADHTISATFAPVAAFTITATAAPNGAISPAGAASVPPGSSQTYNITPDAGFQIANLVVDGVTLPAATTYTFINVTADHTISASFAPQAANLTITAAAAPNGTISPVGAVSVPPGSSQTFTITPNVGFTVANLVVDGIVLPGATSYTFTNVTADHSIGAYFVEQTFTVTASADANGSVTPTGANSALYGSTSSFTITPNAGFQIASLLVDGVALPAASSYSFTSITGNHTISASFTNNFTVTASAGANGTITPTGITPVTGGSNQTYTIIPNAGFVVASLVVDGVTLPGATSYTFSNVTANHTINASFATPPTIIATAGPNGAISPAGETTATYGGSQSYTITPNAGFMVTNLVVDGVMLPGATSYTFTNVTASHYINAYFSPIPASVNISAAAGPGGTISPAGSNPVAGGTDQTYTITPDAGFMVTALVVDGTQLPGAASYTFTNVTADHYVNAYFGPVPAAVTITAAAAANGSISPAGATLVSGGTDQTYTITPDAGFTVTNLVVDGILLPGATSYTFTNVTADHYINAYFGP